MKPDRWSKETSVVVVAEIVVAAADAEIATSFPQIVAFSANGDHSVDLGHTGSRLQRGRIATRGGGTLLLTCSRLECGHPRRLSRAKVSRVQRPLRAPDETGRNL